MHVKSDHLHKATQTLASIEETGSSQEGVNPKRAGSIHVHMHVPRYIEHERRTKW